MQNRPFRHALGALGAATVALALAACEPTPPSPTTGTPGSGQPASAPGMTGSLGGGTATDASGQAGSTETATTMGGGAAAGVPRTDMGRQYGTADAGSVTPDNNAATVPGAGPGDSGTDASGGELRQGGNAAAPAGTHALTRAEQNFLVNAAAAGNFEIAMARLATERGESPAVTDFARALSEHHSQANRELQQLALEKGVLLPTDAPAERQEELRRLSAARGAEFDRLFMERVGLQAHREDIALFERATREAQDPQVQAFAEKMLPRLREHHETAQRIAVAGPGGSRDAGGLPTRP